MATSLSTCASAGIPSQADQTLPTWFRTRGYRLIFSVIARLCFVVDHVDSRLKRLL